MIMTMRKMGKQKEIWSTEKHLAENMVKRIEE